MLHSDGHAEHPINGYFQLDGLNYRSSSPNNFDFVISPKLLQMKYNSVDDIVGKVYSMAKDQIGCRFLQKKFTEGAPEDIEKIFDEIKSHIVELMTDPFGNYLVQKLLEVCNEDQRMCILCTVTRKMGELFRISCDMHGTRAVQRVIETVQTAEQYSMIVSSLKPFVVALIKNVNGNHVAQRCLQHFPVEYSEFVIGAAIAHCVELATDRQGCCVLQKCLHHSDGDQKNRLMAEIAANSLALSQDQYGNYVVQFMLDQEVPWVTSNILYQLEGSYADLSMQKCSSNVVEKCVRLAGEEMRIRIIQELMCSPLLPHILQDPFGNYVIQTVLKECKGALRAAVMEAIRPHFTELRSSPFGKKVLSTILRK
ncbi:pumilio homolog 12-like isoform X2 [Dioscorea cayenensis subsp. rotundata]|uniref:Pumilio homolog 12-like isoform X2 n=1 Tax=Dioscorea cayennensis subsp. rotundata TaxID=55577 RepID=A0AB40BU64_DIOCR|nr:pumilio homolog 12-like isoform X2 [Dioscorea cayenensis subsp. rotundata]